jgi:hypothetical protein
VQPSDALGATDQLTQRTPPRSASKHPDCRSRAGRGVDHADHIAAELERHQPPPCRGRDCWSVAHAATTPTLPLRLSARAKRQSDRRRYEAQRDWSFVIAEATRPRSRRPDLLSRHADTWVRVGSSRSASDGSRRCAVADAKTGVRAIPHRASSPLVLASACKAHAKRTAIRYGPGASSAMLVRYRDARSRGRRR